MRKTLESIKKLFNCYKDGKHIKFIELARNLFEEVHHN